VNNGHVVLDGSVSTVLEFVVIVGIISGLPHTTITNNLLVQPIEGDSDEQIRDNIATLFGLADNIDTSNVNISVSSGVVTLSGSVEFLFQKERLEELVLTEASVVSIINNITVVGSTTVSDQEILDNVNAIIDIMGLDVTAEVQNGVVTLSGVVGYFDEVNFLDAVGNIAGVTDILANFEVVVE
jgi:osmotically-inducible protein OsmY